MRTAEKYASVLWVEHLGKVKRPAEAIAQDLSHRMKAVGSSVNLGLPVGWVVETASYEKWQLSSKDESLSLSLWDDMGHCPSEALPGPLSPYLRKVGGGNTPRSAQRPVKSQPTALRSATLAQWSPPGMSRQWGAIWGGRRGGGWRVDGGRAALSGFFVGKGELKSAIKVLSLSVWPATARTRSSKGRRRQSRLAEESGGAVESERCLFRSVTPKQVGRRSHLVPAPK